MKNTSQLSESSPAKKLRPKWDFVLLYKCVPCLLKTVRLKEHSIKAEKILNSLLTVILQSHRTGKHYTLPTVSFLLLVCSSAFVRTQLMWAEWDYWGEIQLCDSTLGSSKPIISWSRLFYLRQLTKNPHSMGWLCFAWRNCWDLTCYHNAGINGSISASTDDHHVVCLY